MQSHPDTSKPVASDIGSASYGNYYKSATFSGLYDNKGNAITNMEQLTSYLGVSSQYNTYVNDMQSAYDYDISAIAKYGSDESYNKYTQSTLDYYQSPDPDNDTGIIDNDNQTFKNAIGYGASSGAPALNPIYVSDDGFSATYADGSKETYTPSGTDYGLSGDTGYSSDMDSSGNTVPAGSGNIVDTNPPADSSSGSN